MLAHASDSGDRVSANARQPYGPGYGRAGTVARRDGKPVRRERDAITGVTNGNRSLPAGQGDQLSLIRLPCMSHGIDLRFKITMPQ
jgi:hypothetical protein